MTTISTMGQALDQIERLKVLQSNMGTLQQQIASGKKTTMFKGLGTDVIFSERARADFVQIDGYLNNITIADRRIKQMTSATQEVQNQVRNVLSALEIQTQEGEFEIGPVGDLAGNTLEFVYNLLNERDGDRYLFGGAETRNPPITDNGTLDSYLQAQIDDWVATSIDTDQLIDSYTDRTQLTDTLIGYSTPLSSGNAKSVYVRVEDRTEIDYTVLANSEGFRDVVAVLGMISKLSTSLDEVTLESDDPPGTVTAPGATRDEQSDNFYQLFNDLTAKLSAALDSINTDLYSLSQSQAQISQIGDNHKLEKNTLLSTIGDVEDVDLNEAAVKVSSLQIQLEASYRVTAMVNQLSLINFLG